MKETMKEMFVNGFDLIIGGFVIAGVLLALIITYGSLVWCSDASVWLMIPISILITGMSFATCKFFKMEMKSRMEES